MQVGTAITGLVFGISLSRIGFTSWDEVHAMFTFVSYRLLLAFCLAVGLLAVSWVVVRRVSNPQWNPQRIHPGTIAGGILFGMGWAISGACPGIALVQLGEGQLGALLTLVGILVGNWIYSLVHERYFRWTAESCLDY